MAETAWIQDWSMTEANGVDPLKYTLKIIYNHKSILRRRLRHFTIISVASLLWSSNESYSPPSKKPSFSKMLLGNRNYFCINSQHYKEENKPHRLWCFPIVFWMLRAICVHWLSENWISYCDTEWLWKIRRSSWFMKKEVTFKYLYSVSDAYVSAVWHWNC